MIELLVIAGLVAAAVVARENGRRRAMRRARDRAESMLDDLANAACAALAEPGRGRRAERALARYGDARDRVASATTPRDLDRMVRNHELKQRGALLAVRALERVRDAIVEAVPVRR
ncbi:MAG TPA: hypothetical protein VL422_15420 [Miltoncostaea sp.]|nr:hypothetical protein [Miltoncostaea sp.]